MSGDRTDGAGYKVGEVAEATGLTVRTLHHYEAIGLLVASDRSDAGHRRYTDDDVERLYRIRLLRQLGLPLGDIGRALDDPAWSLRAAMAAHLTEVERELAARARLRARLAQLIGATDPTTHPSTDDLLEVLDAMTALDTNVQRPIASLVYADLDSAFEFLVRAFGLGPGELTRDDDGVVRHGELQAGEGTVWLHPESPEFKLASPRTLGACNGGVCVIVDDVDAHHRHAVAEGAEIAYEPCDQPYGYREYSARDPEGTLWSFMKAI